MRKRSARVTGIGLRSLTENDENGAEFGERLEPRRRIYESTSIDPACRTVMARIFTGLEKLEGMTRSRFRDALEEAGYSVPSRTFDGWVACVKSTGTATSGSLNQGRPRELTDDDLAVVWGFVLNCNNERREVHLLDVQEFVKEHFGCTVSTSTVHRYLRLGGLASRVAKPGVGGIGMSMGNLTGMTMDWLADRRNENFFDIDPSCVCSVDFTYTSHRTFHQRSISMIGSQQPVVEVAKARYTNCIVTCVWADGVNRTPAMAFTYGQAFRRDRVATARREAQVATLDRVLAEANVDAGRIVYVGRETGEHRTYAAESSKLLEMFFNHYGVRAGCRALTDKGNAFWPGGESALLRLGFEAHRAYPPPVHHYLSPNDNRLHGVAKKRWRKKGLDMKDDVVTCVALLKTLDEVKPEKIVSFFRENLQLGLAHLDSGRMKRHIEMDSVGNSKFRENCLRAYYRYLGMDARGPLPPVHPHLTSTLDGTSWLLHNS